MKNKLKIFSLFSLIILASCTFNNNITDSSNKPQIIIDETKKETVNLHVTSSITQTTSLEEVIKYVKPSVVDIYSYGSNFTSAGSGVIVANSDSSYYIVTNHHVIKDASSFQIVSYNNDISSSYEATLIGGSPLSDIAVLKVKTSDTLTIASFIDDASKINVGTDVIAIGNPLGILGGTVTKGIVSALQREVYIDEIGYMNLIQTDAAINSGNSGGALFNTKGELIGIVNSGYSSYEGLNFAIPASFAINAFTSIVNTFGNEKIYGYVEGENNIGMTLKSMQIYADSSLNNKCEIVYASETSKDGDAYKNGFKDYSNYYNNKYDTFYAIISINDNEVNNYQDAIRLLQNIKANTKVKISYKKILFKRAGSGLFMQQTYPYLDGKINTITFTASQYVYTI